MPGSLYSKLSDPQRDTLRLYHAHLQIKEIAETLGIAESTVNHRLAQSRAILGQPSSRAAARWMAEHEEALGLWSKTPTSFSSMASSPVSEPSEPVGMSRLSHGDDDAEGAAALDQFDGEAHSEGNGFPWPFATARRQENDLDWKVRLALVLPVAAILMICAMTLVVLGLGFQELLVSFETWVSRLP